MSGHWLELQIELRWVLSNIFGIFSEVRHWGFFLVFLLQFPFAAHAAPMCSGIFADDPYAWLEIDSPERNRWIQKQTGDVHRALQASPNRAAFESYFRNQWSSPSTLAVRRKGSVTVELIDRGLGAPHGTEVVARGRDGAERVIFSSNTLRPNNSKMPIKISLSPDGKWVVVVIAEKGSIDTFSAHLVEVSTGKELKSFQQLGSDSVVWATPESFRYTREKTFEYVEGTISEGRVQESVIRYDALAEVRGEGDWVYRTIEKEGGTTRGQLSSLGLRQSFELPFPKVESVIAVRPDYFVGTVPLKNGSWVVALRPVAQGEARYEVIRRPDPKSVIETVRMVGDHVAIDSFWGGARKVELVHPDKLNERVVLEAPGCCEMYVMDYSPTSGEVSVLLASPVLNDVAWTYRPKTNKWLRDGVEADPAVEMLRADNVNYVVEYSTYRSKDGTDIPMRATYRKDIRRDGSNPTLLQGYGGFGLNNYFHPSFTASVHQFLQRGGVHLAPAIRGSTFFGKEWHDNGRADKKQNVIDDFIGAAEWAIAKGITRPDRIAMSGDSHGGLVVGASVTQRPDLFGLAFPRFGPLDFSRKTILDPDTTPLQKLEYGDLYNDPDAIARAEVLSPFNRIERREYPMVVVTTGQVDSRVNPIHSYRFAARLQDAQTGDAPIWMYSLKNSGHWMLSQPRQDLLAWRSNVTFWTIVYDYFGMKF